MTRRSAARPLPQVPEQSRKLMEQEFGSDFEIVWQSPSTVTIKPKDQPSKLQAALFPMFKTRYSYNIIFRDDGQIELKDNYAITFNRSNGATAEQQDRIHQEELHVILKCQNMRKAMVVVAASN